MRSIADEALQSALDAGASYADVRVQEVELEALAVRNGILETADRAASCGGGVRVLVDGAWGFAATSELGGELSRVARRAVEVGRASGRLRRHRVVLAALETQTGSYESPFQEDPFRVPAYEKVDLLVEACRAMSLEPRIRAAVATMDFRRERTVFVSSEGSALTQTILQSGGGISATAVDEEDSQRRSYPASGGQFAAAGYEAVRSLGLLDHAGRVAEEAARLLSAPECPSAQTTLILGSDQLALQIHESVGHPTELDRVLGMEAAYAGTSFVRPDDLRRLRYGSEHVTIVCDGTTPGGLGTVGW
ncbi:MAG: TldD/PmbA family protein, partial [Candidatus Methylomirabilales bacterium]